MEYRNELNGIRAIAVIAVIIYHLNNAFLPNGFLGVDIFLVLSGFLITTIICKAIEEKKFNIFIFLKKRFFRIYPAYFTVISITLIATFMLFPTPSVNAIRKSAIYSLLGIPNFYYYRNITESYFEIKNISPFLHLWSLGLELQFYFMWAIILLIADKIKINLKMLIILLSLSSFVIAFYFYFYPCYTSFILFGRKFSLDKKFVFYLLPSRIWEFGIGALAHIYMKNLDKVRIKHLFSVIGILMVGVALFFFKYTDEFSPYIALLPCIGTFLLITGYDSESNIIYKILSSKLLVSIGLISYSLYLWHYPLIEIFKDLFGSYGLAIKIVFIISFIFLSIISYKFIESYYRNSKLILNFANYSICLIFLVICSFLYNRDELNSDFYKFTSDYPGSCLYHPGDNIDNFDKKRCTVGVSFYKPNILVVGSSLTNHFVPFLSVFAKKYEFSFVNLTANSTEYRKDYSLGGKLKYDQARIKLHEKFYNLISSMQSNFDILITAPVWSNSEQQLFSKTLEDWSHKFRMVILINPIPAPDEFELKRRTFQKEIKFSSNNYFAFLEREVQKYSNVYYIYLNDYILERKGLDNRQHALFFDSGHLNIGGSLYLARKIIRDKDSSYILKSSKFLEVAKSKMRQQKNNEERLG